MTQTSICGVSFHSELSECSKEDLIRLAREVGRNHDPVRLNALRSGEAEPESEIEKRYLVLITELRRRGRSSV